MGYDVKYGRITTEHGEIGDDEPVVVFRAQDTLLLRVLAFYFEKCVAAGSPDRHLDLCLKATRAVFDWQATHETKVPESKNYQP